MNEKKAKRVRKSVVFHPAQPREYQAIGTNATTRYSKGLRRLYRLAKRAAHEAGLA